MKSYTNIRTIDLEPAPWPLFPKIPRQVYRILLLVSMIMMGIGCIFLAFLWRKAAEYAEPGYMGFSGMPGIDYDDSIADDSFMTFLVKKGFHKIVTPGSHRGVPLLALFICVLVYVIIRMFHDIAAEQQSHKTLRILGLSPRFCLSAVFIVVFPFFYVKTSFWVSAFRAKKVTDVTLFFLWIVIIVAAVVAYFFWRANRYRPLVYGGIVAPDALFLGVQKSKKIPWEDISGIRAEISVVKTTPYLVRIILLSNKPEVDGTVLGVVDSDWRTISFLRAVLEYAEELEIPVHYASPARPVYLPWTIRTIKLQTSELFFDD